jgi:hypothetical protein
MPSSWAGLFESTQPSNGFLYHTMGTLNYVERTQSSWMGDASGLKIPLDGLILDLYQGEAFGGGCRAEMGASGQIEETFDLFKIQFSPPHFDEGSHN